MSADFDVRAKLTLDSRAAMGGVERLSNNMAHLGQQLSGTSSLAGGLVGRLVGIGAAYFGLSAGINTFKSLTASAVNYTSELESTKIGLQTILTAITGASWADAGKDASDMFEKLKQDAIKSPATTGEMFSIFQGIAGPILGAGEGLEKVRDITKDTTLAASALHVDFAQASRDVSMIVRGTAGVDVKMFSLLRSMGAIKETAEKWNKLDQSKRVQKLSAALKLYKQGGDAFEHSWKGVTATFSDVRNEILRAAASPAMAMMARKLGAVNSYFMDNQTAILARARIWGERAAIGIEHAWDRGAVIVKYVMANWGNFTRRLDDAMVKLHAMMPMLIKAAKAYAAVSVATSVGGGALTAGASGMALAKSLIGSPAAGIGAGILGLKGIGAVGAGAGAGAAATAGAAAAGTAAVASGEVAAGMAATGTAAAGAAAALPAVAIGLAALIAVIPPIVDAWDSFKGIFLGLTGDMFSQILDLGMNVWGVVRPLVYLVGQGILIFVTAFFGALTLGVRTIVNAANWALEQIRPFSDWLINDMVPAFRLFWKTMEKGARFLGFALDNTKILVAAEGISDRQYGWETTDSQISSMLAGTQTSNIQESDRQRKLTAQKMSVTNDFRGSRITIDQKFEGDHDPDRVVMAMMGDLTKQAEMRLSSGYANAFTR